MTRSIKITAASGSKAGRNISVALAVIKVILAAANVVIVYRSISAPVTEDVAVPERE